MNKMKRLRRKHKRQREQKRQCTPMFLLNLTNDDLGRWSDDDLFDAEQRLLHDLKTWVVQNQGEVYQETMESAIMRVQHELQMRGEDEIPL